MRFLRLFGGVVVAEELPVEDFPPTPDTDFVEQPDPTLPVGSFLRAFNGTTWDRWRNNHTVLLFASDTRSGDQNSATQANFNGRGVSVVMDVTARSGGGQKIRCVVQGFDPVSGKYYDIALGVEDSNLTTKVLNIYPGILPSTNIDVNNVLPRFWRVQVRTTGGGTFTYSIGATILI